ncbi:adenosylcobinamide-GDP ribazoletransferase [Niallia circulans]
MIGRKYGKSFKLVMTNEKMVYWFLVNIQFFTAIPVRKVLPMEGEFLQKSIKTFPLLGLFQGFIYMGIFFLLNEYTPFTALAVAFIVWISTILLTGGLHLDGWMDASDAYFSYQDAKKIRNYERSSCRCLWCFVCHSFIEYEVFFIYEIVTHMQEFTYFFVMLLPFFSKAVMGWSLLFVQEAKGTDSAHTLKSLSKGSACFFIVDILQLFC